MVMTSKVAKMSPCGNFCIEDLSRLIRTQEELNAQPHDSVIVMNSYLYGDKAELYIPAQWKRRDDAPHC